MRVFEGKWRLKRLDFGYFLLNSFILILFIYGLSYMICLQSFRLKRNSIGDVGCCYFFEVFRVVISLEELDLSYNQIGDVGVQYLVIILFGLLEFRKIDFLVNSISLVGGMQLVEFFVFCRYLEELMFGCNVLGDFIVLGLVWELFQYLRVLYLLFSYLGLGGVLSLIQVLDGFFYLEEISLVENNLVGGVLCFCKEFLLFRQIDLVFCKIDNQIIKFFIFSFMCCFVLEVILLFWNFFGDEVVVELVQVLLQMGWLKRVDLEKNQIIVFGVWFLVEGLVQGFSI